MDTLAPGSTVSIWERVLLPTKKPLSHQEARYLLRLKFPGRDVSRMKALSAKAKKSALSAEEDEELENYIRVGHLLGILQSRARQTLRNGSHVS